MKLPSSVIVTVPGMASLIPSSKTKMSSSGSVALNVYNKVPGKTKMNLKNVTTTESADGINKIKLH